MAWALCFISLAICLAGGRAVSEQSAVELDSLPTLGESSLRKPEGGEEKATGQNFAVSGDPKLRRTNGTDPQPPLPKPPRGDTVLQYKQRVESPKERKGKADLARRMTVKDKVRDLGKARKKTGVVAPVLMAVGYETALADFIKYGCEDDAELGEAQEPQKKPEEITQLMESDSAPIKSCHPSCKECVGTGPKKCTSCAKLSAFVTVSTGNMAGECRAWPSNRTLPRGRRAQNGQLTPPLSGITTEVSQSLSTGKVVTESFGSTQRAQPTSDWPAAPKGMTEFIPQCSWWKQVVCVPNEKYSYKKCKELAGCKDGKKPSWLKETPKECIVSRCNTKKLARLDRICFRNDNSFQNLCEGYWGQQGEDHKRCECYGVDEIPPKYMTKAPSWCKQLVNNL